MDSCIMVERSKTSIFQNIKIGISPYFFLPQKRHTSNQTKGARQQQPHDSNRPTGQNQLDANWTQTGGKLDANWMQTGRKLDANWTQTQPTRHTTTTGAQQQPHDTNTMSARQQQPHDNNRTLTP